MMSQSVQDSLQRELLTNRRSAVSLIHSHPWLIIPDVSPKRLKLRLQGCYRDVSIGTGTVADFVIYEISDGYIHWQLTYVASPTDPILTQSLPSPEFQQALDQVERWRSRMAHNRTFIDGLAPHSSRFSFRIVIGSSRNQTPEEHLEVLRHRRNDLRIRSFDWLLEKPTHYSDAEIATLESCGPARTAMQFQHDVDELVNRLNAQH